MSRCNRSSSPAYRAFVENIREDATDDHEPGKGVRRANCDAIKPYLVAPTEENIIDSMSNVSL